MKTVEFKLDLKKQQQTTINRWLNDLRWVWNEGLSLLLEYHHSIYYEWLFKQLDKQGISYNEIRICQLQFSKRSAFGATCQIAVGKDNTYRPALPTLLPSARIKRDNFLGLTGYLTKERYARVLQIENLPSAFIKGTLKHLADAWSAYKDKKLTNSYIPKFKSKSRNENLNTLYTLQPETILLSDNKVKCPGSKKLGEMKVVNKGISKRWIGETEARTLKICKRPSGYYLQLTGQVTEKPVKLSDKVAGLDVGLQYIYADDAKHLVEPPKYYRQSEKRLRRLQRKLCRQRDKLCQITTYNPRLGQHFLSCPINPRESANQIKIKQKISRRHERTKLQRRAFNHKLSTYLVRTYGGIAVEEIKLTNLNRKPKPKKRENGEGYERNNRKAKAGLNKSFADAGLGQLLEMIEQKAKVAGREFIKVPPQYTSQDCPRCKHRQKKSLSQRTHRCEECGYITQRDHAAAENIKAKANFVRSYRTCVREVKPVDRSLVSGVNQEPTSLTAPQGVEHRSDAATILNFSEDYNRNKNPNCANEEICFQSKTKKRPQTHVPSSGENFLPQQGIGSIAENLESFGNRGDCSLKRKARNINSGSAITASAPIVQAIQLELDLWDINGEISSSVF